MIVWKMKNTPNGIEYLGKENSEQNFESVISFDKAIYHLSIYLSSDTEWWTNEKHKFLIESREYISM